MIWCFREVHKKETESNQGGIEAARSAFGEVRVGGIRENRGTRPGALCSGQRGRTPAHSERKYVQLETNGTLILKSLHCTQMCGFTFIRQH